MWGASARAPLPTVVVSASADASAQGLSPAYAGGQVARGGRLGMLGNVDVMDSPFNATNYTMSLIQAQQAQGDEGVRGRVVGVPAQSLRRPPATRDQRIRLDDREPPEVHPVHADLSAQSQRRRGDGQGLARQPCSPLVCCCITGATRPRPGQFWCPYPRT